MGSNVYIFQVHLAALDWVCLVQRSQWNSPKSTNLPIMALQVGRKGSMKGSLYLKENYLNPGQETNRTLHLVCFKTDVSPRGLVWSCWLFLTAILWCLVFAVAVLGWAASVLAYSWSNDQTLLLKQPQRKINHILILICNNSTLNLEIPWTII